jgi:hypothetical protein
MIRPRIRRPAPSAPADRPAPPPPWLAGLRLALSGEVIASRWDPAVVESVLTIAALGAAVESEHLPCPWVADDEAGSLLCRWQSGSSVVMLAAKGRRATVSAWHAIDPAPLAAHARDCCGVPVGGLPPSVLGQLRNALSWMAGEAGIGTPEMAAAAGAKGKAI